RRKDALDAAMAAEAAKAKMAFDSRFDNLDAALKQSQIMKNLRSGSDTGAGPTGFDDSLASARAAIEQGADPSAVAARLYGSYPKQRSVIDDALKGAGYNKVRDASGGYQFFGPGKQPLSVESFASAMGIPVEEALGGSANQADLERIKQLI